MEHVLKLLDFEVKKQKGTGVAVNKLDFGVRFFILKRGSNDTWVQSLSVETS